MQSWPTEGGAWWWVSDMVVATRFDRSGMRTTSSVEEAKVALLAAGRRVFFYHATVAALLSPWIIRRKFEPAVISSRASPVGIRHRLIPSRNGGSGEHVHEQAAGLCRQEGQGQEQKQSHVIAAGATRPSRASSRGRPSEAGRVGGHLVDAEALLYSPWLLPRALVPRALRLRTDGADAST